MTEQPGRLFTFSPLLGLLLLGGVAIALIAVALYRFLPVIHRAIYCNSIGLLSLYKFSFE